jgi:hypothetical protein
MQKPYSFYFLRPLNSSKKQYFRAAGLRVLPGAIEEWQNDRSIGAAA